MTEPKVKVTVKPKQKEICVPCWERLHTQYDEKTKEQKILGYCPIGVHVLAGSGKCQSINHQA